ncbi:MAG: diacylglycerol kinase [Methylobacterium sp.]|uniref:diacylglycerol/lipid kinase family protein n=1 Tax=Methylobacterium sp. TaxID=409 RepID=UPI0025D82430|nr:diacylglycerol kinase family protein [Methylobacterium sp.]MBX9931434.1 diacylglycerol kinase [Methylobacterium sp.]
MRVALVINATAGAAGLPPNDIRERFAKAGIEVAVEPDETLPLSDRLSAAAALPGVEALVVGGGDGTIACAAGVMIGQGLPLGVLPLGTMNLLAKDLGLPLDLDEAIATISSGETRRIDVGDVNGHSFLINSVLGMPARVARHREALRGGFDPRLALRWVVSAIRHLQRYPKLSVTGTTDGVERRLRFRLLAVVNNDYVEAPGRILVRDTLDGGQLTLYVLARLSVSRSLRLALGLALGDWRRLPGIERHDVTELTIAARCRALRVMNDGEVRVLPSPLRYTVKRRALAVILPRDGKPR